MWNSTQKETNAGVRYRLEEIAVLLKPLDSIMDYLDDETPSELLSERILSSMTKEEYVYALYEVLDAMLNDTPVPSEGHPGYQEAIVADLLDQCYNEVICELDEECELDSARKAAWESYQSLRLRSKGAHYTLVDAGLDVEDPELYKSEKMTTEIWEGIIKDESGLFGEFLWDTDWRMDFLLDVPPSQSEAACELAGMDLEVVHRMYHTPSRAEYLMAKFFIKHVIWKDEVRLEGA